MIDRDQYRHFQGISSLQERIHGVLYRLQKTLCLDDQQWSKFAGLTEAQWKAVLSNQLSYSVPQLIQLCEALEINLAVFLQGDLDFEMIKSRWDGNMQALPERYCNKNHTFSRARSTQTVFQYLELEHGTQFSRRILSRLQIHPKCLLLDPDQETSSKINMDLLTELQKESIGDQEVTKMGTLSLSFLKQSTPGHELSRAASPRILYELFFKVYASLFETLTYFKILHTTAESCLVSAQIREQVKDAFESKQVGHRASCLFRQGFLKSLLGLISKEFASFEELACMYLGSPKCVYRIHWNQNPKSLLAASKKPKILISI